MKKKTHEEFVEEFNKVNTNVELIGVYKNQKTKITVKCKKCGRIYDSYPTNLLKNRGCGSCSGHVTYKGINDLHTTHRHIADMLEDEEIGYTHSYGSQYRTNWICPNCGNKIKNKTILEVVRYGIGCNKCSDGISYPEKVFSNFLSQIGVEYKYQLNSKYFEWCGKYKYDFYIEKHNMIVEVMGSNHYTGRFQYIGGKTLDEEIENDRIKKQLAINNGISHYISINCFKSNIEWISNSIKESQLSNILNIDLKNIDWNLINKQSITSNVVKTIELHNKGYLPKEIAKLLSLNVVTIYSYLKRENDIYAY